MKLIDTHSHIDVDQFSNDRREVLQRARKAGVIAQILPGVCQAWWANLLELCKVEEGLFAALGLHPMYLAMHHPSHLDELAEHCSQMVALGEIGLDYHIQDVDHRSQQNLFEAQLLIAAQWGLPVLLHVRKAHDQVLATIRRKRFTNGGIVHAFSGSLQQAEQFINLGFKISFCGTITYSRALKIRRIAAALPLDAIVLETDAPDIPPVSHHGQRNSPAYLPQVLQELAAIRQEPLQELAAATTANACEILRLPLADCRRA